MRERLAHAPRRPPFRQDDVDQFAFRGHPDGERRTEAESRPATHGPALDERQASVRKRRRPGSRHVALGHLRRSQLPGDDETPALAGLGGRIRKLRHVC